MFTIKINIKIVLADSMLVCVSSGSGGDGSFRWSAQGSWSSEDTSPSFNGLFSSLV